MARLRDLPQITRLEAALSPQPLNLVQLVRFYFSSQVFFLTARLERQVLGYIGFQVMGPIAHIITAGVHPRMGHRGLAADLHRAAERVALYCDARYFLGEVRVSDQEGLRLLAGMGWRQLGVCRRFFADGEDGVVMLNWLSPGLHAPGGQDGAPRRQAHPVGGRDDGGEGQLDGHRQEHGADP